MAKEGARAHGRAEELVDDVAPVVGAHRERWASDSAHHCGGSGGGGGVGAQVNDDLLSQLSVHAVMITLPARAEAQLAQFAQRRRVWPWAIRPRLMAAITPETPTEALGGFPGAHAPLPTISCASMSHLHALADVVASGQRYGLVFEDDVALSWAFEPALCSIVAALDAGTIPSSVGSVSLGYLYMLYDGPETWAQQVHLPAAGRVGGPAWPGGGMRGPAGAQCYLITRAAAQRALDCARERAYSWGQQAAVEPEGAVFSGSQPYERWVFERPVAIELPSRFGASTVGHVQDGLLASGVDAGWCALEEFAAPPQQQA